jgi:hypothetical protein
MLSRKSCTQRKSCKAPFLRNTRKTFYPKNPGLKRTRTDTISKKFYMKTILILKINLIQNTLNFVAIQWHYMHAYLISWDYPIKKNNNVYVYFLCNFKDSCKMAIG